jgi:CHAT domain-containing protein/Tfp pilus assembly protein PilF
VTLAGVAAVVGLAALAPAAEEPVRLAPGRTVERPLAAGESHVYQLEVATGQPLLVVVEQRGIDVVVAVATADGRRLAAVDNPLDRQGSERLLVEPEASGRLALEVRARERGAPPGRYAIRVDPAPATAAGREGRLAAERAATRAGELYSEGTAEAWRQAIAEHERALAHWRAAGDRRREAEALYAASVLARLVDRNQEALDRALAVLPLWQALDAPGWEAATRNEIGLDRWHLGDARQAEEEFGRAADLSRRIGDRYGEAAALANRCLMQLTLGALRAGAACYERALSLIVQVGAAQIEAAARTSAGRAYDALGEPEKALIHYRQALALAKAAGDRRAAARTLTNLGVLRRALGEYQEALVHHGRALAIFEELGDRRWQARALGNLGLVYLDLGEVERATVAFNQALPLWREVDDPRGEAAALADLGEAHRRLGALREAVAFHHQALARQRAVGDRRGEGIARKLLGSAQAEAGDSAAALASFAQAIDLLREAGESHHQAAALRSQGELYTALGEPDRALPPLTAALALERDAGNQASEALTLTALAEAERAAGDRRRAGERVGAALDRFASLRARIGPPDLRAAAARREHRAYELAIELRMAAHRAAPGAGHDRAALELSERERARSLLELLAEAGVDPGAGVDPALPAGRRSALVRLAAKADRLYGERKLGDDERRSLAEEHADLLRELDWVEAEIRRASPAYADLTSPRPANAGEIQRLLGGDTLLLSYALGEDGSYLWALTATDLESFALPGRREIEDAARRAYAELSDRGSAGGAAARLGQILLGPIADRLGDRRLAVVADGALHYVPFAALPLPRSGGERDGSALVLDRHEVVQLPSASVLAALRRSIAERPPAPGIVAIVADPVFDAADSRMVGRVGATAAGEPASSSTAAPAPAFERLPTTRREAEAIAALAPPGPTLLALDFAASRERVVAGELGAYRAVHFATHGVLDAENPALSGLVLSRVDEGGRPRDGFLGLRDLYDLRLDADLVVLSGCRTALGREIRGEGLVGLTRGFLYAGAPRVVASLWRVDDRATAELMARFYRALWQESLRPAAALRAAQQALRRERRWRHPAFWAGFVLVGEWR